MRIGIEAVLDYDFAEPSDVLLALEAAHLPDQHVLDQSLLIEGAGPLSTLGGGSAVGRRTWTRTEAGRMLATYRATVEVSRTLPDLSTLAKSPLPSLPGDVLPFIWPSRYCEADRFETFVEGHFGELDGGAKLLAMRDWIRAEMAYAPGSSDTSTTAADAFVARQGVCRDFAHLMASFARAAGVPARLTSVYAWGLKPPDFHAVVEVWLDGGWHFLDATGLAAGEGLARICVGRDATDIAFMTIFGSAVMNSQSVTVTRLA